MKTITIDLMRSRATIPVPQSAGWQVSEQCAHFLRKSLGLLMAGHAEHLHADAWLSITNNIIAGKFQYAGTELQMIELDQEDVDLYDAASGGLAGLWLENVHWSMSSVAHGHEGVRRAQIVIRRPSMMERAAYAAILKSAGFEEIDIRILVEGQSRGVDIEGDFVRDASRLTTISVAFNGDEVIIDGGPCPRAPGVRSKIFFTADGELILRQTDPDQLRCSDSGIVSLTQG